MSKANQGHTMPTSTCACPVSAGPLLSQDEGSAAYSARLKAAEVTADLDRFRAREPIAGRLVQCLLLRQLAADLAPVLLGLVTDVAAGPGPLLGQRHGEDEPERLVPRRAVA